MFAGARKDHFFFNADGFARARSIIEQNASSLTVNANGCWTGPAATLSSARAALGQDSSGGSMPIDSYQALDALAIVVRLPVSLLNHGGPIVGVSAATYRKS